MNIDPINLNNSPINDIQLRKNYFETYNFCASTECWCLIFLVLPSIPNGKNQYETFKLLKLNMPENCLSTSKTKS